MVPHDTYLRHKLSNCLPYFSLSGGLLLLDIAGILPLGSKSRLHHYSNCLEKVHSFEGHMEEPGILSGFTCFLVIRAWKDFIE